MKFKKPALTSRNAFSEREITYVVAEKKGISGVGECAPLAMLSVDDVPNYNEILNQTIALLNDGAAYEELDLKLFPSVQFGLETALNDLNNGGRHQPFMTSFYKNTPIKINGLVWMAAIDEMMTEARLKIEQGFRCIKFKVGQHDFDQECKMLEVLRKEYSAFSLEIRLDANGAFHPKEAAEQLRDLARFEIHSIEQPITRGQTDAMAKLCAESKLAIALDEELIGLDSGLQAKKMLEAIKPKYIILKPNLLGGFTKCDQWVKHAEKMGIAWWATSALESNIGLNAIAAWVSQYSNELPQGLGTGSLFTNNINSPLTVNGQLLQYDQNKSWSSVV